MRNRAKPSALQYAGLLAAGVASFYFAMRLGQPAASGDDDVVAVTRPHRIGNARSEPAEVASTLDQSTRVSAADQFRIRLDPQVLRDAFSPLDPTVTVESLQPPPPRSEKGAAANLVVRKPKKKEPEPPPPPPPVQEVVAPPPAPTAPPLPFKFLGALQGEKIGNGEMTAFVSGASAKVLLIRAGDVIDNTYKVKSMGAGKIEFIYLPLQTTQSLTMEK